MLSYRKPDTPALVIVVGIACSTQDRGEAMPRLIVSRSDRLPTRGDKSKCQIPHAVTMSDSKTWRNAIWCANLRVVCILIFRPVSGLVPGRVVDTLAVDTAKLKMWGPRSAH